MRNVPGLVFAGGFLFACALVACGGGSSTAPPAAALATATPAVLPEAYLVYPPAGPYAANPDFPSVVLDVSGLNSSYKVTVAPTPIGIAVSYGLNFSPTSLPSPLGSPPPRPGPPLSYATVTMQTSGGVPLLQPVTTYTVTLAGCPTPDNSGNCATTQTINAGTFQTNCGVLPIPSVPPSGTLVYPPAGSTNVATSIGRLILQGIVLQNDDYFGPESVMLTSASGVIAAGTPMAAPSPLPSPLASGNGFYSAVSVPPLAAATTYTVMLNYADWGNVPPACRQTATLDLGSFTTQ